MQDYLLFEKDPNIVRVNNIETKAIYLDSEREKEAVLFEEMSGNHEIQEFYDLVNSPENPVSEKWNEKAQSSATKTIYSTLNPVKSLTLNVSVGNFLRKILCVRVKTCKRLLINLKKLC